jgi:succinoglycan biosynthesis protein ExoW
VTEVAVVIPYFQRQPGILRRSLNSIYEQELPRDVSVRILVVDDASPSPPEPETEGLARAGIAVTILKRENGGPAEARNTGLDAAEGADVVAFLDSDDTWMPGHLATGLSALATGAEFYFADNWYEDGKTWFEGLSCRDEFLAAAKPDGDGICRISNTEIMPFMLAECLAHTSTVMFDNRRHGAIRFDVDLARAGEDYLFWLSLASAAGNIAFSARPMAARGRGVDLYRGALAWNRPECICRLFYALMLHKKILERFCRTPDAREHLAAKLGKLRRGILYLLIRNALAHGRTNCWVLRQLASKDRQFWSDLPRNAYVTFSTKLRGNFDFPVG